MRVDERIRKCVGFVGIEANNEFYPAGTGFLVGFPYGPNLHFSFLVTADHVLDGLPENFALRLNRREGFAASTMLSKSMATRDIVNDVAIFPMPWTLPFTM